MRLLLDALRALFALGVRFAALLGVLFGLHVLGSRALPEVRRTAALLEDRARVAGELQRASAEFEREQREADGLQRRLSQAKAQQQSLLRSSAATWERKLDELEAQRIRLERQLAELRAERAAYCDTYNPFKLWYCREVEARTARVRETLEPLVAGVEQSVAQSQSTLEATRRKLDALERGDPQALGPEGAELVTLGEQIERSRSRVQSLREQLRNAERRNARLQQAAESPLGWTLQQWQRVWVRLVGIVVLVLLLPYLQRTLWYYVLMPLAARARPLRLVDASPEAALVASPSVRTLAVRLNPGQAVSVRAGYARPVEGRASSQLFYRWKAPFISYSAGLVLLTRIDADPGGSPASVTLASPDDPESYLLRVDLSGHPGVVLHPRHLVGVMGDLELRTAWRIWSIHAWATGQLRYILLAGTGSLVLEGRGDIVAGGVESSRVKIEQQLVVGFDARLDYKTARTETFLPYLFGKTPLVDDVFEGSGCYFWQKSSSSRASSAVERTWDALFGAIGKLLGF